VRAQPTLRALAPLALLLLPTAAPAVWTWDVTVDVPVCTADGYQDNSVSVPDGAGGVIVAWEDGRAGSPGMYAQRLDAAGIPQWTPNGVLVSTAAGLYVDAAPDGSGGVFVSWVESGMSRVQHLDADGVPQWAAGGEATNTTPGDQRRTKVVADGAGGCFVVWQDYRSGWSYHIYAQHHDASGSRQWGNGALASGSSDWSISPQADKTPAGDLLVAFHAGDLKASCLSAADGSSVWPEKAVVAAAAASSSHWKMVSDGAGGTVLAFLKNSDRVYATRIDGTGTRVWTDDVPVGTLASAFPIELLESSGNGAYVCWRDTRDGLSGTIAVQHLDAAGAPLWPANGVVVEGSWCAYTGHGLCSDGAGGVIVEWQGNGGLMAQRVDASGAELWTSGGEVVATGAGVPIRIGVVADGSGGAIAAYTWDPNLGIPDIRAERVSGNGNPGGPTSAPLGASAPGPGVTAYPNPFRSSATVAFSPMVAAGKSRVDVLDVTGRRIRTLVTRPTAEGPTATWDGRSESGTRVPAGVYFVRERTSGETGRLIRLR
jgi:hypothetical protein